MALSSDNAQDPALVKSCLLVDTAQRQGYNYAFSPACRLPDEVLAEIFAVGYHSKHHHDLQYDYAFAAGDQHILRVSQVCARWRVAALSTATLWASLCIRMPPSLPVEPSYVEGVALRLARSRLAPIHLHLSLRRNKADPLLEHGEYSEPVGQLFSFITSNLDRCYSLTVDANDISPIFPLKVTPVLKHLKVRALSGDLEKLVLFREPTEDTNLQLEELSIELPMFSRTSIVLQERLPTELSETALPQAATESPTPKLRALRFVKTGDENGPLEIISSASRTLEELDWRESTPCTPSLSTTNSLYLPSLRSLYLEGYSPLPPFTPPEYLSDVDFGDDVFSSRSSILPRLNALQILPKGFQQCRRYMFLSEPLTTTPTITLVPSSPSSELETFLRRSHLPSLRHFELAGIASSIIPSPHSPASASVAHIANNRSESALEIFLASHSAGLDTAHVPFLAMPSLIEAFSPSVLSSQSPPSGIMDRTSGSLERGASSPLVLKFAFRNSYMPDPQRSVAFLRSLLHAAETSYCPPSTDLECRRTSYLELVLARDTGVWEHAYRNLEKEYDCGSVRMSLHVSQDSSSRVRTS